MNRDDIRTEILNVCKVNLADGDFNATRFCSLCDKLIELGREDAAEERNKLAQWMIQHSYATGHGDTVEDLLKDLEWQVRESERKAFVQIAKDWDKDHPDTNYGVCIAEAIKARSKA